MFIPDVGCVIGQPVSIQRAACMGFEAALVARVKALGSNGFLSSDEMAEWTTKMLILSGGRNSVKWISDGAEKYWPSIVVRRIAGAVNNYIQGAGSSLHPAFTAGGAVYPEFWAGKYPGPYVVSNSKTILLSLPGFGGKYNIFTGARIDPTHDTAVTYGFAGGNGAHCMTNAEWMEIALSCLASGFQPKGNNNYGIDSADTGRENMGIPAYIYDGKTAHVVNGSGPLTWFHDGTVWGVWGMNGNFYQWTPGFRQKAGKIQVIANNDAALADTDQTADTGAWKEILSDGSLVDPGTAGTLGYDATTPINITANITTHTTSASKSQGFGAVAGEAPPIAKILGVAPAADASILKGDSFYLRNDEDGSYSETLALRGGSWHYGSSRGVFCLYLYYHRAFVERGVGARAAFL